MVYRPEAAHRRNPLVAITLTAAIHRVFGYREQDQGRPLGAFYTRNVSKKVWSKLGGIWYRAQDEQTVQDRTVDDQLVQAFSESIITGRPCNMASGTPVTWEEIPYTEAVRLPRPL